MAGRIVGVHGDEIIENNNKFEVVDAEGSYLSCQLDSIYDKANDEESPGVLIDVASGGPVHSLVLSVETMDKMFEWYKNEKSKR